MRKISKLILGLVALPMCLTHARPVNTLEKANALDIVQKDKKEVIDLQAKVFEQYYAELKPEVQKEVSLEDFKKMYKEGNMTARQLVTRLNSFIGSVGLGLILAALGLTTAFGGSFYTVDTNCYLDVPDADYIISDNHNRTGTWKHNNNYHPKPTSYSSNDKTWATEQPSIRDFDYFDNNTDLQNLTNNHGPRRPVYFGNPNTYDPEENNFEYYYNYIQEGDIVWDPISGLTTEYYDNVEVMRALDMVNAVTHMGMVVQRLKCGRTHRSDGSYEYFNFIETVEAVASGVRFGFLDDERILRFGTKVLRVFYATDAQRRQACDFMVSQVGKPYQLKILDPYQGPVWNRNNSTWYCTQLVFAAYYETGMNICLKWNAFSNEYFAGDGYARGNIIGCMIANSSYVGDLFIEPRHCHYDFLKVWVHDLYGDYYQMEVINESNEDRIIAYNPKLCGFAYAAAHFVDSELICAKVPANSSAFFNVDRTNPIDELEEFTRSWVVYYVKNNQAYATMVNRVQGPNTYPTQFPFVVNINRPHVLIAPNNDATYTIQVSHPSGMSIGTIGNLVPESDLNRWNFRRATAETLDTMPGYQTEKVFTNAAYYGSYYGVRSFYDGYGNFKVYKFRYNQANGGVSFNPALVDSNAFHMRFCLVGKVNNKWRIRIQNLRSEEVQIAYINKMTTENNAKTWTNLSGMCTTVYIPAYSSMMVDITINGNNPAMGVSHKYNGKRYLSWAKNFKDKQEGLNGGTLTWNVLTLNLNS